jgi:ubiquitin carboxyl-terminal hydrolase 7
MKASVLESPGDLEILEEKYSTWEIRNYSKLQQRNHSPEFECGGFKWYFSISDWTKS